jgi:hypothetical protein
MLPFLLLLLQLQQQLLLLLYLCCIHILCILRSCSSSINLCIANSKCCQLL